MSEWKETTLGALCDIQTGPFGSQLHNEDYVDSGIPIVTVEHLGSKNFTTQNLPLVSDEDALRLNRYKMQTGDVIFSRVGSVDRCSYASSSYDGWLYSGRCLRVRSNDFNFLNPLFLFYHCSNPQTKSFIRNIAVGATMPSINTKLMQEVPIKVPSLLDQQKIASILSSLDDKIETNRAINERLEQLAAAIFKSWFIDFEPFGGQMPNDWKEETIGSISCINEAQYSKKEHWSDFLYLDTGSITENKIDSLQYFYREVDLPSRAKRKVKSLDIVYSTVRPNQRHLGILLKPGDNWLVSTGFAVISAKTNEVNPFFLYFYLAQPSISDFFQTIGEQSACAYPSINSSDIANLKLILPDINIQNKFGNIVSSFYFKKESYTEESARLAELRDTLLPRLMSGELIPE